MPGKTSPGAVICLKQIVPDESHVGCCKGCPHNTNAVPVDPAVLANIQQQRRSCKGCGDGPMDGV